MTAAISFHRPSSEPVTSRKIKHQKRRAPGACTRSKLPSSFSHTGEVCLEISGSATSLPFVMPEGRRVCSISGQIANPIMAERPTGSKMMVGVLASAFLPLQDCNTFRQLREASKLMNCRTQQLVRHHAASPSQTIPSVGKPCSEAWIMDAGGDAVRQALITSTTRQCCRLLRRGWESMETALQTVPILAGLRDDGLLDPVADVQAAAFDALLHLLSRGPCSSRSCSKPSLGSFAAWTGPGPEVQSEARARRPPSAIQLDVQQWAQQAHIFARLSESSLLPQSGLERVGQLLEAELRRCLRVPTPQDLRRVALCLAEGGAWLGRALGGPCTKALLEDPSIELHDCTDIALPESVCEIVTAALRVATQTDHDGPVAIAAREALQRVGLVNVSDEFPDCSAMVTRRPSRCSSAPGFGHALVDVREGLARGRETPTVLENGLNRLEAAKAILRENRLPPGGVRARGSFKR